MPKNWFFEIYEDTPEEESATLMEHSTLTLDLSSDDESTVKARDDRGKENMPPEDYDAPTASCSAVDDAAPSRIKKSEIVRKKVVKEDEMDDGQRSPLSDLETEEFIPDGLTKESHVIVLPTPEKKTLSIKGLFATPAPFSGPTTGSKRSSSLVDLPVVSKDGDLKGEIIIFEDSPSSSPPKSVGGKVESEKVEKVVDENTAPAVDEVA
jgi:hypothetical protein